MFSYISHFVSKLFSYILYEGNKLICIVLMFVWTYSMVGLCISSVDILMFLVIVHTDIIYNFLVSFILYLVSCILFLVSCFLYSVFSAKCVTETY
jgi:hypothetical protein